MQYMLAGVVHSWSIVTVRPPRRMYKSLGSAQVVIVTLLLTLATVTGAAHRSAYRHIAGL